jgi:hypothetical protein
MTWTKAYQKCHAKTRQRRRRTTQERLARDRRQAQHAAEALQQALYDLGLPDDPNPATTSSLFRTFGERSSVAER